MSDAKADDPPSVERWPSVGDRIAHGRYRIEHEQGRGSMGIVFGAVDTLDGSPVALKVLHPRVRDEPSLRRRFHREARCGRRLRKHPNLVGVLDHGLLGEYDDLPFLTMPFVRGPNLSQLLALQGPLQPQRAARLIAGVARGLLAAHRDGIVHRDVKPDNVLVDVVGEREVARVVDFGLAVRVGTGPGDPGRLTLSHQAPGTPYYMAPEQIGRTVVLPALDVYAVGATLFTAVVGVPPPQHRRRPQQAAVELPAELRRLVDACMVPEPHRRPRMAQVAARLEDYAAGGRATRRKRRQRRRRWWPWIVAAAASFFAGAAATAVSAGLFTVSASSASTVRVPSRVAGCYAVHDTMTGFQSDDKDRLFCEVVAQLIISDAKVTDSERDFLERLMDRFGLDEVGKRAVINSVNIGEPIAPRLQRLDAEARRALLAELEAAAAVDGEIGNAERSIIEEVRSALEEAG